MHSLAYLEHLSYFGIFIAMATTGYLVPLPEEVILLVGGYLIASHVSNPWIMLGVSFLGAITGDAAIFYLCHHGSRLASRLKEKVEKGTFKRHISWFRRHSHQAIFLTRFIPGMRFASPVISGFLNIPWRTFLLYNGLAALIFVPLITAIGFLARHNINEALRYAAVARHAVIEVIVVLLILLPLIFFVRAIRKHQL